MRTTFLPFITQQRTQKTTPYTPPPSTTDAPAYRQLSLAETAWSGVDSFDASSLTLAAAPPAEQGIGTTLTGQYATFESIDKQSMIYNNIWNMNGSGADPNQKIDVWDVDGSLGFEVHANHGGDGSEVKSYPFIGTGWHFGENVGTKLPAELSSLKGLTTEMNYTFAPGTKGNFAEEAWLFPPGAGNPKTAEGGMELMVRHAQDGLGIPGEKLLTAEIGGKTYDVYYDPKFSINNAQFLNFVEQGAQGRTGTHAVSTDWKAITDFATDPNGALFPLIKSKAAAAGVKPMDSTWSMYGLEAGFELSGGGDGCEVDSYKQSVTK